MNADQASSRQARMADSSTRGGDERLSALVDGEVQPSELDELLSSLEQDELQQADCLRYQLIGDLMRNARPARNVPPHVLLSAVRARLRADVVPGEPVSPVRTATQAANDSVFRWKLVAGLASVAAVMAVGWSLIGVAPGASAPGAQLAQLDSVKPVAVAVLPASESVVVNTAQGPVIRDARLEELLAEHRQYGGMSALQMPAGFLRDATYQSAPQR